MTSRVTRLTISLPEELVQVAEEIAREQKTSRSKVLSSCLQELAKKRFYAQMEEGYKSLTRENLELAETAVNLAHEVLPDWE